MTSFRLDGLGRIDRSRPLAFTFDGRKVTGFAGDTVATALLASGVSIVGRSFKYHRARGVWGLGSEEPNAIVDIRGSRIVTNARATLEDAADGLAVRSVNASPNAEHDRGRFIDLFHRFMPSGFYYKTFMLPTWHLYEPGVRAMAGFGRVDPAIGEPGRADQVNAACDLLVVGGGPAGVFAALAAAEAGRSVILCDEGNEFGGSLLHRAATIDGLPGEAAVEAALGRMADLGVTLLTRTTAFGVYDHGLVALSQRGTSGIDRLWRVRPKHLILATGAIERPLPFANNDLPGIRSAEAALAHLRRWGIAPGRRIVVATNNGLAHEAASAFVAVGLDVVLVDARDRVTAAKGVRTLAGRRIVAAKGRKAVTEVVLDDGARLPADAVLVSGGFSPTLQLYAQARGKPVWDDRRLAFLPGAPVEGISVVGAAAGHFDLAEVLASTRDALLKLGIAPARRPEIGPPLAAPYEIVDAFPKPGMAGRVWIDLQHDVTAKDVEVAAREAYVSVEHLKRYTTLGMATDQGRTSNLPALALMAAITGRSIPATGTTTYRPPFAPVPLASFAGLRSGPLMNPPRRLVLENQHRAAGAQFREYGGWLRPAWYGDEAEAAAVRREARQARRTAALFDGSPLGKIEVIGPQAAEFLDFVYYNTMSTLKPGRCRYGFVLAESGVVLDDGVLVRIDETRFVVSCSSSHVAAIRGVLEEWRQDRFDRARLFVHDATAAFATLTVSGPLSKRLLVAAGLEVDLDDRALPHMAWSAGRFEGTAMRVTRVSFTGDRSYEITLPVDRAPALWARLVEAGRPLDAVPIGIEALMVLRAEKGYVVVGKDTDGLTLPMDLGMTAPLAKKPGEFIGKRSLLSDEARRPDRKQFVGLEVTDGGPPLAPGAHGVETVAGKKRSLGYVTSSAFSPTLGRPIALGLIERGGARHGETIEVQHLGKIRRARIAAPCAFDPQGGRLDADA